MPIATTNPATGEVLKTFDQLTEPQIEDRLARARGAVDRCRETQRIGAS